jgi:DNA-binding CsgD family transcriptional regulator
MLKSSTTSSEIDSSERSKPFLFPRGTFERFSKPELLAALQLMHRILHADQCDDLERLVTELPELVANRTPVCCQSAAAGEAGGCAEHAPPQHRPGYLLLSYFLTCFSTAHARIERKAQKDGTLPDTARPPHLSPRELSVLLWMKEGKTNWEIARILGLTERTVRFHVGSIFKKLDVSSRTQAVARAMAKGLIAS